MSLPYRFKAGGSGQSTNMGSISTSAHHHRNTTKVNQKPFKSKFASKSALRDQAKGRVENRREDLSKRRTPHQQVMSKLARRNQSKQLRINHKEKQEKESNIFHGLDAAPKHVAVVSLSPSVDAYAAINKFNISADVSDSTANPSGSVFLKVDRFRRSILYLPAPGDLLKTLEVCQLADWVIFVMDAEQTFGDEEDVILRAIEGQGITNVAAIVDNLDAKIAASKRSRHMTELKLALGHYFPSIDRLYSLDSVPDCSNLLRSLCTASTKGIRWRDSRSWMLIDDVQWLPNGSGESTANVVLSGNVRGHGLQVDRLVHVPGWGDFQLHEVRQIAKTGQKRKADEMSLDQPINQWQPSSEQDDLAELAPEQVDMTDRASTAATQDQKGVLLDDHHYFSDDDSHLPVRPKKLPKGTSDYQAAWYLDDMSDSDSDMLDEDVDADIQLETADALKPEDGMISSNIDTMTEAGLSEYPESETHMEDNEEEEAKQLEEYRANRKREAEEDLEFPDEIELNPEILARERLIKYRGLKSLRTSEWNTAEDLPHQPSEYERLLQIADYKKSNNVALKEALRGGILAGTRTEVELRAVPLQFQSTTNPISMFSLLRHEHKQTVVNINMTLSSEMEEPVRSKEELIVQIGHRRLTINPIFSAAGQTPNDVHKFDRFLHPGRTAIATFTGPLTWGAVPVLVFKRTTTSQGHDADNMAPTLIPSTDLGNKPVDHSSLQLIGTATTIPPSTSRVIAKRIILTGHPFKIHKKLVTIRYMFFNREDVAWFAALPLWTKRGRQGFIKEPLGTHGYLKATFDGRINPMDAVGVSLYKRVWPRVARKFEL